MYRDTIFFERKKIKERTRRKNERGNIVTSRHYKVSLSDESLDIFVFEIKTYNFFLQLMFNMNLYEDIGGTAITLVKIEFTKLYFLNIIRIKFEIDL